MPAIISPVVDVPLTGTSGRSAELLLDEVWGPADVFLRSPKACGLNIMTRTDATIPNVNIIVTAIRHRFFHMNPWSELWSLRESLLPIIQRIGKRNPRKNSHLVHILLFALVSFCPFSESCSSVSKVSFKESTSIGVLRDIISSLLQVVIWSDSERAI